ncbi:MAG: D-alanine--D-alanine ligase [Candidatus Adiutrix sp.]|jgi:D-alanine-D-alanine ligase|nr:D-alanine--D-alanine ligase [Candidatus Adiutrix sp.]
MEKIRVALLRGGKSAEREVSLNSGAEVLANLDRDRFTAVEYDPAADIPRLASDAQAGKLDVAFLALHGPLGEDGTVQGLMELLGLPYTGSGVLASALAMDKEAAKKVFREAGLPVAPDMVVTRDGVSGDRCFARTAFHALGSPLVVKPVRLGSSVGMSIVRTEEDLAAALTLVFGLGGEALLEKYLPGPEFTCGVVGSAPNLTALPIIEIIPAPGHVFFDYSAKYEPGQSEEVCPARVSPEITSEVQRLAANAHRALGCRTLSRSDFIFFEGRPYLLETNTLPGLTSGSLVPKMARAFGLTFTAFLSYLLDDTLKTGVEIKDYL